MKGSRTTKRKETDDASKQASLPLPWSHGLTVTMLIPNRRKSSQAKRIGVKLYSVMSVSDRGCLQMVLHCSGQSAADPEHQTPTRRHTIYRQYLLRYTVTTLTYHFITTCNWLKGRYRTAILGGSLPAFGGTSPTPYCGPTEQEGYTE